MYMHPIALWACILCSTVHVIFISLCAPSLVLSDMGAMERHLAEVYAAQQECPAMADAVVLFRVWARQRGLALVHVHVHVHVGRLLACMHTHPHMHMYKYMYMYMYSLSDCLTSRP